ncbi:MAG TPA: 16S rRNA (guanine(527)-N(7))-methyltransferase RsmG [Solirubrobacterales bacterium]|nr:16S rRNA (guanine(527)-N(7))-methyltransferase RsmG [Solirubrobacterales bacterium]
MSAESRAAIPVSGQARAALEAVLEMLAEDRSAPSAVRDPERAWRVHVADSLTGLEVEALRAARRVADLGAGAGFPGLPVAVARPECRVDLIEATRRKCEFIRRAIQRAGIKNAEVVCERSEAWAGELPPDGGREGYDAVTARAVGRLSTLAELASPLLVQGGALVAWKGRRDAEEEAELRRASARLAMEAEEVRWVGPYAGSRNRHLHILRKTGPTPGNLPRRPGMAKKRPLGAISPRG